MALRGPASPGCHARVRGEPQGTQATKRQGTSLAGSGYRRDCCPFGCKDKSLLTRQCTCGSSARSGQAEGKQPAMSRGTFQRALLLPAHTTQSPWPRSAAAHTDKMQPQPLKGLYLVGVGRQEGQSCSNAALGCQQVGILAHLLGQEGPHSVRVHGLGELHGSAQDDHLLYQILGDQGGKKHKSITNKNSRVKQAWLATVTEAESWRGWKRTLEC